MPRLFCETVGQGPDVVLLHGWGMHAGVWEDVVEALIDDYRVTVVDLPGHGRSQHCTMPQTLEALCHTVLEDLPERALWVGWSLGGLVAQQMALMVPKRVYKLALVSSTPCFVQRSDWPWALPQATLRAFAEALQTDYRATLQRFLALEVHGSVQATAQLQQLKAIVLAQGEPDPLALATGLECLKSVDLRTQWPTFSCPVLLLLGQRDQLVPAAMIPALQALLPSVQVHLFSRAAHAPFLSHQTEFLSVLRAFFDAECAGNAVF